MTTKKRKTTTARSRSTAAKSASGSKRAPRPTKRNEGEAAPSKPKTKRTLIKDLLERSDGASISELMKATGWQEHSVRAALTVLRHNDCTIVRTKLEGGPSRFRIDAS
jgi:hypothetical protein